MNPLSKNIPICFANDPQYIVKLIGKVIPVSLETMEIPVGAASQPRHFMLKFA